MKILIVGTAWPYRGGLASFNERLAEAFQERKIKTTIYTFTVQYPNFLFPGKSQFSEDPAPTHLHIERKVNSVNPFNWADVGQEISRLEPDLVIFKYWLPVMGPAFGTLIRWMKRNKKTKVLTILDNVIPHEKRIGDALFTKYFVKPVDAFIAMSRSVLADLKKFTSNPNTSFIPHPIYDNFGDIIDKSVARSELGYTKNDKVILFFGIIRKYKGLDLLLEAMADIRIKDARIKLLVAGEFYDDESDYMEIIDRRALQSSVRIDAEFIPNDKVKYYFCAADIIVQPYRSATQSGISQMAYHFEKPMIVTNVGGLPEIVPDGEAGYVTAIDPKEIADAILNFYDGNKEGVFVKNVKELKKQYSWDSMVDEVLRLYESLI